MKGVVLAGGEGRRLMPLTKIMNKHLFPIYDKPMIFYPIQNLIACGIKDILIVTGESNQENFFKILGNGEKFGVTFTYRVQKGSEGVPIALQQAKDFVDNEKCMVILGDNFIDQDISAQVKAFFQSGTGASIFLKQVECPERYGVAEVEDGKIKSLAEKPGNPRSNLAVTGIYLFDHTVFEKLSTIQPSQRGEYEILDVLHQYLEEDKLNFNRVEGFYIDAGTFDSLLEAGNYIQKKTKSP